MLCFALLACGWETLNPASGLQRAWAMLRRRCSPGAPKPIRPETTQLCQTDRSDVAQSGMWPTTVFVVTTGKRDSPLQCMHVRLRILMTTTACCRQRGSDHGVRRNRQQQRPTARLQVQPMGRRNAYAALSRAFGIRQALTACSCQARLRSCTRRCSSEAGSTPGSCMEWIGSRPSSRECLAMIRSKEPRVTPASLWTATT